MSAGLFAAFLCSGAAALLFETLWFRLTGLGLGNSVWASSVVLAAFMAGLALGNALAARLRRPRGATARGSSRTWRAPWPCCQLSLVLALPALGAGSRRRSPPSRTGRCCCTPAAPPWRSG